MITGSTAQLGKMNARLGELIRVPSRAARAASERVEALIQEEFDTGTNPYGDPWAPLSPETIKGGRSAPPLTATGAMRGTVHVFPAQAAGISVTIDKPAGIHQTGWAGPRGKGPARPVLPNRNVLPETWVEAINEEVAEAFGRATK